MNRIDYEFMINFIHFAIKSEYGRIAELGDNLSLQKQSIHFSEILPEL